MKQKKKKEKKWFFLTSNKNENKWHRWLWQLIIEETKKNITTRTHTKIKKLFGLWWWINWQMTNNTGRTELKYEHCLLICLFKREKKAKQILCFFCRECFVAAVFSRVPMKNEWIHTNEKKKWKQRSNKAHYTLHSISIWFMCEIFASIGFFCVFLVNTHILTHNMNTPVVLFRLLPLFAVEMGFFLVFTFFKWYCCVFLFILILLPVAYISSSADIQS